MNVTQLKNISDLVKLDPDKRITSHTVKRLTSPGENFGSLMLSVDISISTPNGPEEIHAAAKMVPPNEYLQDVFDTQTTFRNEIGLYKDIVPLLQSFQKEHGVVELLDVSARYYGSRLNLSNDESGIVDSDGALVVQNLKAIGYQNLDRLAGLDSDVATLVLENLARFHAVPLALRMEKPDIFEKVIKPYLKIWFMKDAQYDNMRKDQLRLIEANKEVQHLKERILRGFEQVKKPKEVRETFATLIHDDCWMNNIMFKPEGGKVVKNKMVDYQIINYGSPAKDVLFFIFSSVKGDVVKEHYDTFLKMYHQTFIRTLKELGCDVKPYTFEAFLEEIEIEAKRSQFGHLAFMLLPTYAPAGTVKDISEIRPEDWAIKEITNIQTERYLFLCSEFAKRGWI